MATGPMLFTVDVSLSPLPSTCFLLLFEIAQVPVQAGKLLLPETAKGLDPVGNIPKREGHKCARTPLCFALANNEARAFEHAEMLGDCRLT